MTVAGTPASNSYEALTPAPKLGTADREGRIGNDAAFSMSYLFHELCRGEGRGQEAAFPPRAIRSARLTQE
jgi:hypothetical protein